MNEETKLNLNEWIKKFIDGNYADSDINTQSDAGWFDWFCRDTSLQKKTEKLGKKLIQIEKSKKFDNEKCYIFFKNNCPCHGSLYDDFRICDIETGDIIYTITPKSGHAISKGLSVVYGKENDFKKALIEGTWKEIKEWFLS